MVTIGHVYASMTDYAKDNYYLRDETTGKISEPEKIGEGWKYFGDVRVRIDEGVYKALKNGCSPVNGEQLVKVGVNGEHRPGWDIVFAPHKSFSVYAMTSPENRQLVQKIHDMAVADTLNYLEKNLIQVKQTHDGVTMPTKTGNMVAVKVDHTVNREGDVNIHSHVVIFNMAYNENTGKWQALHSDAFHSDVLQRVYENQLAYHAKQVGLPVAFELSQSGKSEYTTIAGISQEVIEAHSQRVVEIKEYLEKNMVELQKRYPDASMGELKRIATIETRPEKIPMTMEQILQRFEQNNQTIGITTQDILLGVERAKEQMKEYIPMTAYEMAKTAADAITEHQSVFSQQDLVKTTVNLSRGDVSVHDIMATINDMKDIVMLKSSELVKNGGRVYTDAIYTTLEVQKAEKDTIRIARSMQSDIVMSKEDVSSFITQKEAEGVKYTESQKEAIEHILTSENGVILVQGDAGTGKSTAMAAVREKLESMGYTVRGFAPTGKATEELRINAGVEKSQTLHSFLHGYKPTTSPPVVADKEEYARMASRLSEKEWEKLRQPVSEKDLQNAIKGSWFKDTHLKYDSEIKVMTVKAEKSLWDVWKNRVMNEFRNFKNEILSKIGMQSTYREVNREYMVYTKYSDGTIHAALQKTHWEVDRKGNVSYTSTTYHQNGDIYVFQKSTIGGVTRETSTLYRNPANVITKGKEVWILDEASMVGSKQMHELLKIAKEQNVKVVLIGDVKQLQAIEQGRVFKDLQERAGLKIVEMKDLVRQQEENYKATVKDFSEKRFDEAFRKLENKGRIVEIADKNDRITAIVRDYIASPKDTIVVTALNADKAWLNSAIHAELQKQGVVDSKEYTFTVRESKNLSAPDKLLSQNYQVGDVVISSKAGLMGRAGTEGKVIEVDYQNHRITAITKDGKTYQIDLRRDGDKLAVYAEKEQSFAKGERIVFQKNDRGLEVKNGQVGELKSIDADGRVTVKMQDGTEKKFNLVTQYNYIDRGYAVTAYKSQGQTAERVIYHADTEKGVNYNEAYVALTRGKTDIRIYTDSKERFTEQMKNEVTKSSTLDYAKETSCQTEKGYSSGRDREL
ncbi:MobF family relaxase [Thermodesulfovibrio sp. 3462-1]|uniref:MobF family relaxase n=1 Tax=Thermodesulfovibrio obliviosus TaxID=3118332 RepID=A0AAU8GZG1_9BACT